jgi:Flp pilus assembly protein TadG
MQRLRSNERTRHRRGVAAVEAAIVLPVAILILFAGLDVALVIQRQHLLTECACRAARHVIVRGEFSQSPLGPTTWSGTAADSHPVAAAIRPLLPTLDPAGVGVVVEWTDGKNRSGQKLNVQLSSQAPTLVAQLFGARWAMSARSTMLIAN